MYSIFCTSVPCFFSSVLSKNLPIPAHSIESRDTAILKLEMWNVKGTDTNPCNKKTPISAILPARSLSLKKPYTRVPTKQLKYKGTT